MKDIPLDVSSSSNSSAVTTIKNCSCVAFRLDDIQDYYVVLHQKAVIDVFKEFDIPLTIGVIGYYFGQDVDIVNYVKSAQTYSNNWSGCHKVHISLY